MAWRHGMTYLVEDIVKRVGTIDSKADKDEVCLWVRKRSETVVLLLSSGIP